MAGNEIFDFQKRIAAYDDKIIAQSEAYEVLGDHLATIEGRVKQTTLLWVHANPELAKKLGMERAEMWAAITDEQRADYYDACAFRLRCKVAEKVMDATLAGLSGQQSLLKYSTPKGGF